jgi:hypothetical protein
VIVLFYFLKFDVVFPFQATSSGQWYINSLETPSVSVIGASVPGVPLVFMGRNKHISWAFVSSAVSEESILSVDSSSSVTERLEVIKVRGVVANNETYVTIAVREVESPDGHLLPLVSDIGSPQIRSRLQTASVAQAALSSPALQQRIDLKFLVGVSNAESWDQFVTACSTVRTVALNVLFADEKGDIGVVTTGDTVSSVINPTSGFVCASSDADPTADQSRLEGFLQNAVSNKQKITTLEAEAFMLDVFSPSSLRLAALVTSCSADQSELVSSEVRLKVAQAKALVQDFDGRYLQEASAPVLLEALRVSLATRIATSGTELVLLAGQTAVIRRQTLSHK